MLPKMAQLLTNICLYLYSSVVQFVSLMLGLRNSHFSHECIFLIARKNLVKKWLSYYGWKTTSRAIIRFSVVEEGDFLNI